MRESIALTEPTCRLGVRAIGKDGLSRGMCLRRDMLMVVGVGDDAVKYSNK